jgi:hypothetical protein
MSYKKYVENYAQMAQSCGSLVQPRCWVVLAGRWCANR